MKSQLWILISLGLPFAFLLSEESGRNWVGGGEVPGLGRFENTEPLPYPWGGVDASGTLRKSVAIPTANPIITKSNQFSYAWLGSSVSFVDMDADGLRDLVSPDGNGIFWFWKNSGSPENPVFTRGESMPLLIDDLRSGFAPILGTVAGKTVAEKSLTPSQEAARRRIDEKREREIERLLRRNERLPKNRQIDKKEIEKQVAELIPYDSEKAPTPLPTPANRVLPAGQIPPGGLSCTLNSFRRLRLIASPTDWNVDGTPDFVVGDSSGTVYLAPNTGKPGQPNFGYCTRLSHALPLKVVRAAAPPGKPPVYQPVEFMNYAMPFVCDWDGNGIPDLLVGEGTYSVNSIRLFSDAAKATLQNPPREEFVYVGEERTFLSPFAYDWDGDGDLDLFVCDSQGRLTVHRRGGSATPVPPPSSDAARHHPVSQPMVEKRSLLDEPKDLTIEGGHAVLAFCTPQPCDWNKDGTMDLIWGDPFGRVMVALGLEKGGMNFGLPMPVMSSQPVETIEFPTSPRGTRSLSLVAAPARASDGFGGIRNGGTASAERFYRADGTSRENSGGWPGNNNKALYGQVPSWSPTPPPLLEDQLEDRSAGVTGGSQGSWGIAPLPGDIWEVVDETGAPGEGRTLRLRWHDVTRNSVFKTRTPRPPQWTPGVAIHFSDGRSGPFCEHYTKGSITIKFHMKLDGEFSRLDVKFGSNWGPLGANGKPPAEGGHFLQTLTPPPKGQWFEFSYTQSPDANYQRGLDSSLSIELLGEGEVRLRDVRVFEN